MAARWRSWAWGRGFWGCHMPKPRVRAADSELRLHRHTAHSVKSIHCNHSNRPVLRAVENPGGPEYIPQRKAKNPMRMIGLAWLIGLPSGIIIFLLAKREVDKNRLKQLKVRQRMKSANEGEYQSDRYQ
ncbi:uncharacterized protein [Scyliorhinus torazame]|uniref:uncharacterized protein n=1 Tax=Scyliorhinus torazame TaxID=75743 RepID=UPI003B5BE5C8